MEKGRRAVSNNEERSLIRCALGALLVVYYSDPFLTECLRRSCHFQAARLSYRRDHIWRNTSKFAIKGNKRNVAVAPLTNSTHRTRPSPHLAHPSKRQPSGPIALLFLLEAHPSLESPCRPVDELRPFAPELLHHPALILELSPSTTTTITTTTTTTPLPPLQLPPVGSSVLSQCGWT